jgi:hypothetical protein
VTLILSLEIMMRGFRSLGLLMATALGATLMTGCASEPVKTPPPPAPVVYAPSPEQTTDIIADFQRINPDTKIGRVAGVDASSMTVVVSGIPIDAIKLDGSLQSIQFVDGHANTVANGTIDRVDKFTDPSNPYVVVTYTPTPSGRAPMPRDLAVYTPNK